LEIVLTVCLAYRYTRKNRLQEVRSKSSAIFKAVDCLLVQWISA